MNWLTHLHIIIKRHEKNTLVLFNVIYNTLQQLIYSNLLVLFFATSYIFYYTFCIICYILTIRSIVYLYFE